MIGLFFVGMIATVIFFMVWFKVMEYEHNQQQRSEDE